MRLFIKKMDCHDSISIVERELNALGIRYYRVERGVVNIKRRLSEKKRQELKTNLLSHGLELVGEEQHALIEKTRAIVKEFVDNIENLPKTKYSDYVSKRLNYDYVYAYVAILFSKVHGTTIEKTIILLKIERVKELLIHSKLNVTQIASKLHFNNVAYLADQFKQITGLTAMQFRKQNKI